MAVQDLYTDTYFLNDIGSIYCAPCTKTRHTVDTPQTIRSSEFSGFGSICRLLNIIVPLYSNVFMPWGHDCPWVKNKQFKMPVFPDVSPLTSHNRVLICNCKCCEVPCLPKTILRVVHNILSRIVLIWVLSAEKNEALKLLFVCFLSAWLWMSPHPFFVNIWAFQDYPLLTESCYYYL